MVNVADVLALPDYQHKDAAAIAGFRAAMSVPMLCGGEVIGAIGFEGRMDYGAIGTVTNLAARLCAEAGSGEILTNRRTLAAVEHLVDAEQMGEIPLKGFSRPVPAARILSLKTS